MGSTKSKINKLFSRRRKKLKMLKEALEQLLANARVKDTTI